MNEKGSSTGDWRLVAEILRYLIEHPDAKDTAEGIVKWWLVGTEFLVTKEGLQIILDAAVGRGWLVARKSGSGRIYGLNKSRAADIRILLQEPDLEGALKCNDC